MAVSVPFLPITQPLVDLVAGFVQEAWRQYFQGISGTLTAVQTQVNAIPGAGQGTLAAQPTGLGPSQAGQLYYVTDYGHQCRWDGAKWVFAPGDVGNGFYRDFAIAPQDSAFWQECDGTAVNYLVVGGTSLTTASFTTPNLKGTPAFRRSGSSFSTTINAATAPAMSGATGTGTTGTGTTGTGTTGTGTTGGHVHGATGSNKVQVSTSISSSWFAFLSKDNGGTNYQTDSATDTVPGLSVPGLSVPGLSVPGLSIPALGVGTIAADATGLPANMTVRVYFRI